MIKKISLIFLFAISISLALITIATALKIHVYLPVADLQSRHEFLFDAYLNGLSLDIFLPHNSFHWIVIPNTLFSLDMIFFKGSNFIPKYISVISLVITLYILGRVIYCSSYLSAYKKSALIALMIGFMSGPWIIESLINPISQYAIMILVLVLTAYFTCINNKFYKKSLVSSCVILLLMTSAQLISIVVSFFAVYYQKKYYFLLKCFYGLLGVYLILEIMLFILNKNAIFLFPYSFLYENLMLENVTREERLEIYCTVLFSYLKIISYFFSTHIFYLIPIAAVVAIGIIYSLVLFFIVKKLFNSNDVYIRFWLFLIVFCITTVVLFAYVRFYGGYTNRFSNLSGLLFVSLFVLIANYNYGAHAKTLIVLLSCYLLAISFIGLNDLKNESKGLLGMGAIKSQLAYSIGISNPRLIVNQPDAYWSVYDIQYVKEFSDKWRKHGLGVYSTYPYQIYSENISLPKQTRNCNFQVVIEEYHHWEGEKVAVVSGKTLSTDDSLVDVIFFSQNRVVGRSVEDLGRPWYELFFSDKKWNAYIKLSESIDNKITAIAYNKKFKCSEHLFEINNNYGDM